MIREQGGDESYIYHTEKFQKALCERKIFAGETGYISSMNTEMCGKTAVILGAGRETKESSIDNTAGIHFYKKTGEQVGKGEVIATLYSSEEKKLNDAASYLEKGYTYSKEQPKKMDNVIARVSKDGVVRNPDL